MSTTNYDVLNVIYNVFGNSPRKHSRTRKQIAFDCPECDNNKHKGNLEINYGKLVMKCWACSGVGGPKGPLRKLVKTYGSKHDLKLYDTATEGHVYEDGNIYNPNYKPDITLPKEYISLNKLPTTPEGKQAYNYLIGRGINDSLIKEYDIGYCSGGKYDSRIIIPSYDKENVLNFFVSRGFIGQKQAYDLPIVEKTNIIVNESNINWDSTIFLVEGMFDMIGLGMPNTIPLLGKELSQNDKIYYTLLEKAKGNIVICLDPDATREAYKIYQMLDSTFELAGRVRVIDLPLNMDIAAINQKYGRKGVLKCIRKMRQLELIEKLNYNLI